MISTQARLHRARYNKRNTPNPVPVPAAPVNPTEERDLRAQRRNEQRGAEDSDRDSDVDSIISDTLGPTEAVENAFAQAFVPTGQENSVNSDGEGEEDGTTFTDASTTIREDNIALTDETETLAEGVPSSDNPPSSSARETLSGSNQSSSTAMEMPIKTFNALGKEKVPCPLCPEGPIRFEKKYGLAVHTRNRHAAAAAATGPSSVEVTSSETQVVRNALPLEGEGL